MTSRRKFTPQQKLEIVLASLKGNVTKAELCRQYQISDSLLARWREQLAEAALARYARKGETVDADAQHRIAQLERALGRKTYELEIAGKALRGWE